MRFQISSIVVMGCLGPMVACTSELDQGNNKVVDAADASVEEAAGGQGGQGGQGGVGPGGAAGAAGQGGQGGLGGLGGGGVPVCGDGFIASGEGCDDGNMLAGDGCGANCDIESGYACTGQPSVCSDIDECATGLANCGMNTTCANTPGSFACGCIAGFGDCDADPSNGCETDLATNAQNCGACGIECSGGVCDGTGMCVLSCSVMTFAPSTDYPTGIEARSVAGGDLNGDGKPDLAVVNRIDSTVSVLMNNGDGTFAAKVDHATTTGPLSVAIADLNGDGPLDLVVNVASVIQSGNETLNVFLNNGNGSFAPGSNTPWLL